MKLLFEDDKVISKSNDVDSKILGNISSVYLKYTKDSDQSVYSSYSTQPISNIYCTFCIVWFIIWWEGAIMAPKYKFTKEEMVEAALRVVRTKGIGGLTAKTMADELGTSTQPIFTSFGSMEGIKREVYAAAVRVYDGYTDAGLKAGVPFSAWECSTFDLRGRSRSFTGFCSWAGRRT